MSDYKVPYKHQQRCLVCKKVFVSKVPAYYCTNCRPKRVLSTHQRLKSNEVEDYTEGKKSEAVKPRNMC